MNHALIKGVEVDPSRARSATQYVFLVCGLGISSWAPMVPYAKERLGLNDADLGLLLLFLGAGAITMMPITGIMTTRYGSRSVILSSTFIMALSLPMLLLMTSPILMGLMLFVFGAAVGTIDVAMNAHGVQVQNIFTKPIMSSLHGLFSVGGLLGSLGLGFFIKLGLEPIVAAIGISFLLLFIVCRQYANLLSGSSEIKLREINSSANIHEQGRFSWLKGSVLFLGIMCFIVFLSEGAMLDWSAVFLREIRGVSPEFAGSGYAAFSIAMAIMRLIGDRIVVRLDGKRVVVGGSLLAAFGLFLVVFVPWISGTLVGFVLLGLGAANIVPVFFSEGGKIRGLSPTVTIPAITTMGYAGQLAGPAILGFIAYGFSLPIAFAFIGGMLLLVALSYGFRNLGQGTSS
ncbi:MFS transporter [Olivibacter sp. CPCC 100613]|uniref:MFS transporter n=1 Tax=Olivibacter sp. CPCC 100613 TaxID=3079931 RepID=UPI002FFC75F0